MFLRNHWIPITVLFVALSAVILDLRSETDVETPIETPLAAAETRVTAGEYYEAILALEPLLMSNQKSDAQEESLWLAHTLLVKWERGIIDNASWGKNTDEKIAILNQLGADFDNIEINFGYRYGFLRRLIDAYPNTPKQPIAEYALIRSGYPVPQDIFDRTGSISSKSSPADKTFSALHAYIEKYKRTGRAEVYMAYLDIAHIHHGLWAVLTFPDHPYVGMFDTFSTGDPETDKKLAEVHRDEALKYYAKFSLNPHGIRDNFNYAFYGFKDESGYELLQRKAAFGWVFILYGC